MQDELLIDRMRTAEVVQAKLNKGGSSISFRLDFADGSRAAFKPEQINPQTVPRKEVAAYRISRFLGFNVNQVRHMVANDPLAVLIERRRKPEGASIRQRTKTSVQMIETRVHQLHRDNETAQHVGHSPVRLNVGAKLVTAKERVAGKERVAFTFEELIGRQPDNFVAVFLHPLREERRFRGAFLVPKITRDKFPAHRQPGIGGEDHVWKFRLRRDEMDFVTEADQFLVQPAPLLLDERGICTPGAAHPGVNLVLYAVVIW